jgi:hypothetical protein
VQAQGMLFDIMPDHKREIDDLNYLLRDALWSSQNSAPEAGAYVRRAARAFWLNNVRVRIFVSGMSVCSSLR